MTQFFATLTHFLRKICFFVTKRKSLHFLLFFVILNILIALPGNSNASDTKLEKEILGKIRTESLIPYRSFKGVAYLRKTTIRKIDGDSGKLIATEEILERRKDFFYGMPEVTVVQYKIDGKLQSTSEYEVDESLPLYPVFDKEGTTHYKVSLEGEEKIGGRDCYVLKVVPRENTKRHFQGKAFYSKADLKSVLLDGSIAKLRFGLKELRMKIWIEYKKGVPVMGNAEFYYRAKVPILYPNTIFEVKIQNLESDPIPN